MKMAKKSQLSFLLLINGSYSHLNTRHYITKTRTTRNTLALCEMRLFEGFSNSFKRGQHFKWENRVWRGEEICEHSTTFSGLEKISNESAESYKPNKLSFWRD